MGVAEVMRCACWEMVDSYPLRWFFLAWLCWEEFFDSGERMLDQSYSHPDYRRVRTGHGDGVCAVTCDFAGLRSSKSNLMWE